MAPTWQTSPSPKSCTGFADDAHMDPTLGGIEWTLWGDAPRSNGQGSTASQPAKLPSIADFAPLSTSIRPVTGADGGRPLLCTTIESSGARHANPTPLGGTSSLRCRRRRAGRHRRRRHSSGRRIDRACDSSLWRGACPRSRPRYARRRMTGRRTRAHRSCARDAQPLVRRPRHAWLRRVRKVWPHPQLLQAFLDPGNGDRGSLCTVQVEPSSAPSARALL